MDAEQVSGRIRDVAVRRKEPAADGCRSASGGDPKWNSGRRKRRPLALRSIVFVLSGATRHRAPLKDTGV